MSRKIRVIALALVFALSLTLFDCGSSNNVSSAPNSTSTSSAEPDFGNEVNMVRFNKYFGEMPKTERLKFRQYKEDATRVIALQTGDIDYCQTPSIMELEYILSDPNLKLIQMVGTRLN